jgi:hypothetical protein
VPLVALDGSWAVCLPKKVGSQSLVGMLTEDAPVARTVGEWHGATWDGTGRRLLVVRDPRERLASMYWWSLAQTTWNTGPGGASEWFSRFLTRRTNPKADDREWVTSQREYAAAFRPDEVFRLEEGLESVCRALGVEPPRVRRANETAGKRSTRKPFGETFRGDEPGLSEWLTEDAGEWYTLGDLLR